MYVQNRMYKAPHRSYYVIRDERIRSRNRSPEWPWQLLLQPYPKDKSTSLSFAFLFRPMNHELRIHALHRRRFLIHRRRLGYISRRKVLQYIET
jgi:hypothetical protein